MKLIQILAMIVANKDLILEAIELIQKFFPQLADSDGPVIVSAPAPEMVADELSTRVEAIKELFQYIFANLDELRYIYSLLKAIYSGE